MARSVAEIVRCISPDAIHPGTHDHARHWLTIGDARAIYNTVVYLQQQLQAERTKNNATHNLEE